MLDTKRLQVCQVICTAVVQWPHVIHLGQLVAQPAADGAAVAIPKQDGLSDRSPGERMVVRAVALELDSRRPE
jgi:hypothetical protein